MNIGNDLMSLILVTHTTKLMTKPLVQYFYSGLTPLDRNYVDVAAEGAFSDKTPIEARTLIARMAKNTQTFGSRTESLNSSSIEISELKNQMSYLISMVTGNTHQLMICGVCGKIEHFNDQCPLVKDVNPGNGFRRYEPPSSNFYNPS